MADQLCEGRIVFTLEGGYQLEALAYGVSNACHALLGEDTAVDPLGPSPRLERSLGTLIEDLQRLHHLN
jgi:acetoin utilization deacetylase AcuC-like enzyme